ncbi:hypothetical protein F0562_033466 [Nyssa sinensis]|uniref:O-fucosyltransferase family protein n=1 Tax=Nyssa sinensis TaxID=561372 RepID=A0A5J5AH24_9ASTE|nr:hypothetical protein F0562_033466 [Nyssa sinensis]
MAPLLEMFPLLQTKEMLASSDELAPFKNYSSRMAAIDYTVCLHSELLFHNPNIGWKSFKRQVLNMRAHSDSKGIELKRPNDSIYSFPCPDCMCRINKTEGSRSSSVT